MLDLSIYHCVNPACVFHNQRSAGNIRKYGHYGPYRRQVLQCSACKKTFSETCQTAFFGSHYSPDTIRNIILCIAEGHGIRETARRLQLSKDSVNKIVKKAGDHCRMIMLELLHDLHLEQCQMDELCSFVKKNRATTGALPDSMEESGAGSH